MTQSSHFAGFKQITLPLMMYIHIQSTYQSTIKINGSLIINLE